MQFKVCDAVLNLKESDLSSYVVKKIYFWRQFVYVLQENTISVLL